MFSISWIVVAHMTKNELFSNHSSCCRCINGSKEGCTFAWGNKSVIHISFPQICPPIAKYCASIFYPCSLKRLHFHLNNAVLFMKLCSMYSHAQCEQQTGWFSSILVSLEYGRTNHIEWKASFSPWLASFIAALYIPTFTSPFRVLFAHGAELEPPTALATLFWVGSSYTLRGLSMAALDI